MTRTAFASTLAGLLLAATALTATAADLPQNPPPAAAPVLAGPSPWMVRVRALAVVPQASADYWVDGAPLPNASADISTSFIPELDISYFFTSNIAAELVLGTTPHNVKGTGALVDHPIGSVWLLPPTLTLQYHFTNFGAFKPYVGAGINYTIFYNEDAKGVFTSFNVENQFGFALQAGFDYMLDQHWGINVDVKKIWLQPNATAVIGYAVPVKADVNIDPWLIGAGITYRF